LAEPRTDASRPVTRADLRTFGILIGVDIDDEQSIERWNDRRRWVAEEKSRQEAAKERRLAYSAGFIRWLAAGIGTTLVGWLSGAFPWLKVYWVTRG
jgi:hypothetical protein